MLLTLLSSVNFHFPFRPGKALPSESANSLEVKRFEQEKRLSKYRYALKGASFLLKMNALPGDSKNSPEGEPCKTTKMLNYDY